MSCSCSCKPKDGDIGMTGPNGAVGLVGATGLVPSQNIFSYRYDSSGTVNIPPEGGTLIPFPFDTAIVSNTNFDTGTGILTIDADQVGIYVLDVNMYFFFRGVLANTGVSATIEITSDPGLAIAGDPANLLVTDKPYNGYNDIADISFSNALNTIVRIVTPCTLQVRVEVIPDVPFQGIDAGTLFLSSRFMGRRIG